MKKEKTVETKTCQKCSSKFKITDKDLEFYDKISPKIGGEKFQVPTPTFCPECREQRRLSFRNERKLYKRKCDATGKEIISMFSPKSNYKVYDHDFWWSDKWDPMDFGQNFDSEKSFFEQFSELKIKVPAPSLNRNNEQENCHYSNYGIGNKNGYFSFASLYNEDIYFCYICGFGKNIFDCTRCDKGELCYECVDAHNCYKCFFVLDSENCSNSIFLKNCKNCQNCFSCSNLNNKKYYIYNKEYSKEDYEDFMKNFYNLGYRKLQEEKEKFLENIKHIFVPSSNNIMCEDVFGDYVLKSKNLYNCHGGVNGENLKYTNTFYNVKDIMDCSFISNSELCYECLGETANNSLGLLSDFILMSNCYYCNYCQSCSDCFGCVGLRNKKYCIFNKQYSKEEYEKLVPKIIKHMQKTGEWGEFFPASISPFGYNETIAQEYYPLTKEEALKEGFNWSDYEAPFPKVEKIIPAKLLPENISDIPDDILNRAIECEKTKKPFRIIKQELEFYRKHNLPIPKKHPDVRHLERLSLRNPRKLYDRKCDKCEKEIKTTYSPDRSEIVYCEECYLKEVM